MLSHTSSGLMSQSDSRQARYNYWMVQLSELISTNTDVTLRSSVNAVSMLFYSDLAHKSSIDTECYKWYVRGLKVQRQKLRRDGREANQIPSPEAICVPLMISFYKTITSIVCTWKEQMASKSCFSITYFWLISLLKKH